MRPTRFIVFTIVSVFIFFLGFFTHAVFFTYDFVDGKGLSVASIKQQIAPSTNEVQTDNGLVTYVDYNNGEFTPSKVTVTYGNYVAITNRSKTESMWLDSDSPLFRLVRGYGESERLQVILDEKKGAIYTVWNKNDPRVKLTIEVK